MMLIANKIVLTNIFSNFLISLKVKTCKNSNELFSSKKYLLNYKKFPKTKNR